MALSIDTLSFHLQNAKGKLAWSDHELVRHCQIRLSAGATPSDFYYRLRGGDLFILHEVLLDECYRLPPLLREPVNSIVDLGGNIGSATLSFAMQFPHAKSFVCVEPDPRNARILEHNVSFLGERARVIEGAVGGRDGVAEFATTGVAWEGSLSRTGSASIQVPLYRLDTLLEMLQLDNVDVLKVDIEGAEKEVFALRGAWWEKVKLVIAELHSPYGYADFKRDMEANGFRTFAAESEYGNVMPIAIRPDAMKAI